MTDQADKSRGGLTWERSMEILKVVATVWAAVIGTFVTMQFNERQHELARIEAIAKMLPNLDETSQPAAKEPAANGQPAPESAAAKPRTKGQMSRDGAIWAIFRTANNKTMLKDLASLFPEDIYRVVSSIAVAGGLQHDDDAITALQVASEKLAARYSSNVRSELASKLYSQAISLKQLGQGSEAPVYIVDLNEAEVDTASQRDHLPAMLASINQLGKLHMDEADRSRKINAGHWQAKQLFKRVLQLGKADTSRKAQLEVAKADLGLYHLYLKEERFHTAADFLKEALYIQETQLGKGDPQVASTRQKLSELEAKLKPDTAAGNASSSNPPAGN